MRILEKEVYYKTGRKWVLKEVENYQEGYDSIQIEMLCSRLIQKFVCGGLWDGTYTIQSNFDSQGSKWLTIYHPQKLMKVCYKVVL